MTLYHQQPLSEAQLKRSRHYGFHSSTKRKQHGIQRPQRLILRREKKQKDAQCRFFPGPVLTIQCGSKASVLFSRIPIVWFHGFTRRHQPLLLAAILSSSCDLKLSSWMISHFLVGACWVYYCFLTLLVLSFCFSVNCGTFGFCLFPSSSLFLSDNQSPFPFYLESWLSTGALEMASTFPATRKMGEEKKGKHGNMVVLSQLKQRFLHFAI